jgi:small-conductance mechanosensitive channel
VLIGPDTVLQIQARVGAFTPAERAAAISNRLRRLANTPFFSPDSLVVVHGEGGSDIVAGDVVLLTVTDADAAAANSTREQLAREHAQAITRALSSQRVSARLRTIAVGAAFALLTALATILAFRLVQRLFGRAQAAVAKRRTTWTFSLRIQRQVILSAQRIAEVLLWLLGVLRVIVLALLLYVSIPLILSFFPWTRGYAQQLFSYILTPFARVWLAFVAFIPNLFTIGAICVVTWYVLKLVRLIFVGIARGNLQFSGFYPEWAIPTYKLVRLLVFAFAFVMVWPYLPGSESPAFRGVGVILGLLISFGSASAVSNAVGGVVLTYMRPFRVGDRVKIADTEGDVIDKDLLVTRIRTIKNVDVTIPNAMVLSSHIVNYSATAANRKLVLNTTVTIGYDAPWRQVHELLRNAALRTAGILPEPEPFVLQRSLDDFYVSYELNAHTDQPHRMAHIYSELHANIQDCFNDAGVEIMSPHYRAERDGNAITIPVRRDAR